MCTKIHFTFRQSKIFVVKPKKILKHFLIKIFLFFRAHGFPNNFETYGLISALWTSSFALGAFIGPSLGGILLDNINFRNASMFIVILNLLVASTLIEYKC